MKSTPAAVLNSEHIVGCWKVQRVDGTVLCFTNHDRDLLFDSLTWLAASGFSRTATRQTADLNPDNLELFGLLSNDAITDDDLAAGKYTGAKVWYFEVDWSNPAAGKHKLDYGKIGKVIRTRSGFHAEFVNMATLLSQTIGDKYGRTCRHTLGDSNCGIELAPADWQAGEAVAALAARKATSYDGRRYVCTTPGTTGSTEPTWNSTIGGTTSDGTAVWTCYDAYTKQGTVTAVTSRQQFTDSARTEADDLFTYGKVTWLTGANAGLTMHVKQSQSTGAVTLLFPMPFDITAGDTYAISYGCSKQLKMPGDVWGQPYTGHCRIKFNPEGGGNAVNYGGFPEMTGNDQILAGPQ